MGTIPLYRVSIRVMDSVKIFNYVTEVDGNTLEVIFLEVAK